jgi:HK97 family phage prohead protease
MSSTKNLGRVEVKDADKGMVSAVFCTFDVIDHDGDVIAPGAIPDGLAVRISAYNHKSWDGAMPVGKGTIRVTDTEAILEGQFFLGTTAGRDTFELVKQMGDLQEWSWGFDVLDAEPATVDGRNVRRIKRTAVHEVSPVLLGAGLHTRTLATKSAGARQRKNGAVPVHDTTVVDRPWDGYSTVKNLADDARPSELRSVHAWVDPEGDPELKTSYAFAHHHGVGGPANLRACLMGIADLNGDRGASLSEADRKAAYEHLAAHVRDADREPPELRATGGEMKFNEELLEGLARLSRLIDGASRVVAQRAEMGKQLSKVNAEVLGWIVDDLKRLEPVLTTPAAGTVPEEDITAVLLASIARVQDLEGVDER